MSIVQCAKQPGERLTQVEPHNGFLTLGTDACTGVGTLDVGTGISTKSSEAEMDDETRE